LSFYIHMPCLLYKRYVFTIKNNVDDNLSSCFSLYQIQPFCYNIKQLKLFLF